MGRCMSGVAPRVVSFRGLVHPTGSRAVTIFKNISSLFILSMTRSELNLSALQF